MSSELTTTTNQTTAITTGFDTAAGFELLQRIARAFVNSTLVPKMYQDTPDNPAAMGNCIIALNMANRIHADPMMVMQNLVIVQGRPSWSAKFLIATINASGRFSPLRFVWQGIVGQDDRGCKAVATDLSSGDVLEGPLITIRLAKEEGWFGRNGSKWKSMPEKMTLYRAGAWWSDIYAPEMAMGLRTDEENLDTFDSEQNNNGTYQVKEINPLANEPNTNTTEILEKLAAKKQPSKPKPALVETKEETQDTSQDDPQLEPLAGKIMDKEDPYATHKDQVTQCKNKGQLSKIYGGWSTEDKAAMKDIVKARQDKFNATIAELKAATKPEPEQQPKQQHPEQPTSQPEQDWESVIRSCTNSNQLTLLLNGSDPSIEMEYSAVIDEMYDSFRESN